MSFNFNAGTGAGPNTLDVTSSVPQLSYTGAGTLGFGSGNPVINYTNFQTINVTKPAAQPVGTGVTIPANEGQTLTNVIVATFTQSDLSNVSATTSHRSTGAMARRPRRARSRPTAPADIISRAATPTPPPEPIP